MPDDDIEDLLAAMGLKKGDLDPPDDEKIANHLAAIKEDDLDPIPIDDDPDE